MDQTPSISDVVGDCHHDTAVVTGSDCSYWSRAQLEEELKKTQLQNSQLRQETHNLQVRIDELELNISTSGAEKPKKLDQNTSEISGLARKFCVMNEAFFPNDLRSLDLKPSATKVDIFNPATRYVSKSSQLQGFVEEIFYVLPTKFHDMLTHTKIFNQFKRAQSLERSHQISVTRTKAPQIFGALGTFTANQFTQNSAGRQRDDSFRRLIGADEGYPVWAPLLFPDLDTRNMDKVFMAPCFQLLLKFMLFKNRAFDPDPKKVFAGAKPAGKAWNVTSVSPGFVAFRAVVARFLFSPDDKFEAKGDVSSINYAEDFVTYKRFLLTTLHQKVPAIITLFKNLNECLFGNGDFEIIAHINAPDKDSSMNDPNAPLTNLDFDDAMQRLLEGAPTPPVETSSTLS